MEYLGPIDPADVISHEAAILARIHGRLGLITGGAAGLATEATLGSLLTLMQGFNDDEVLIARDTVTGILYVLQITEDESSHVRTQAFYDVDGNPFVPTNPMELMGASDMTSYVEGSSFNAGDLGLFVLGVGASGNYEKFNIDASGYLKVHDEIMSAPVESAFKQANENFYEYIPASKPGGFAMMAVRNDGASTSLCPAQDLDWSPLAVNENGVLYTANNDVVSSLANITRQNDIASNVGDYGVPFLVKRNDNIGVPMCDTDGDYGILSATKYGELFVYDQTIDNRLAGLVSSDNSPSTLQGFNVMGQVIDAAATVTYAVSDGAGIPIDYKTGRVQVDCYNYGSANVTRALDRVRSLTGSTTGLVAKASPGNLYRFNIINTSATIIYVKLYNKATAAVFGDTPVYTIPVPAGVGSGVADEFFIAQTFSAGLSYRVVTGILDADVASPVTSPIIEFEFV